MPVKKAVLFVDDEPNVIQGLKRMLRSMWNEWVIFFAGGGEEALAVLSSNHIDVVVSDMRMPGMDGAELLGKVMELYPHIIRIILSGHSDREMILRTTRAAHQFLAKPCDAETLKETIERACQLRDLLNNEALGQLVAGVKTLPSLPSLYHMVLEEVQSPNTSLKKVGEIVARDVTMTARILQFVNSAFFGLPQRITSPQQAVTLLGLDTLKALVLYVQVFSAFKEKPGLTYFSIEELWRHSMMVGSLAREISLAVPVDRKIPDDSLIAGILHEIGKLLFLEIPGYYEKMKDFAGKREYSLLEAEYELWGTSHAEAGAYLLGLWGFPDSVIEAVAFHHRPSVTKGRKFSPLTAVHTANALLGRQERPSAAAADPRAGDVDLEYLARLKLVERLADWSDCAGRIRQREEEENRKIGVYSP